MQGEIYQDLTDASDIFFSFSFLNSFFKISVEENKPIHTETTKLVHFSFSSFLCIQILFKLSFSLALLLL